jgi:hypothetical protein
MGVSVHVGEFDRRGQFGGYLIALKCPVSHSATYAAARIFTGNVAVRSTLQIDYSMNLLQND